MILCAFGPKDGNKIDGSECRVSNSSLGGRVPLSLWSVPAIVKRDSELTEPLQSPCYRQKDSHRPDRRDVHSAALHGGIDIKCCNDCRSKLSI